VASTTFARASGQDLPGRLQRVTPDHCKLCSLVEFGTLELEVDPVMRQCLDADVLRHGLSERYVAIGALLR